MSRDRARGLAALLLVGFLLAAAPAAARPGGGHSYRGGGGGGGSSRSYGGGGGGFSFSSRSGGRSTPADPYVFAIIVVFVLVSFAFRSFNQKNQRDLNWSTSAQPHRPRVSIRRKLEALREVDPDFSVVLFEDFLQALYGRVHEARGLGHSDEIAAYVPQEARAGLLRRQGLVRVEAVVVGAMSWLHVAQREREGKPGREVAVRFDANYTEVFDPPLVGPSASRRAPSSSLGSASLLERDGRESTCSYWVTERWSLWRSDSARSRPPEKIRDFGCPSCGAPLDAQRGSTCAHCGNVVDDGSFDWVVTSIRCTTKEPRGPQLTGTTEERGTSLETVEDPGLAAGLAALQHRDPAFTLEAFRARVGTIFATFQVAWSNQDPVPIRPYLTDQLLQTQLYWMESYRRAGLRNMTEKTAILAMKPVRVTQDRWYDALTVRLHATGLDYTLDTRSGRVVGGSMRRLRRYSEYWTLVRSAKAQGAARADGGCPACGAPTAKVNMTGCCEHCGNRLVSGEFDWVLSRIEQDEAYEA